MRSLRSVLCLLIYAAVGGALRLEAAPKELGQILYRNVCLSCHGAKGEGNILFKAPPIAAEPAWYIMNQMGNFRQNRRGFDPKDKEGQMMRAAAMTLDEGQLQAVAQFVEHLRRGKPEGNPDAPIEPGRQVFSERCMPCHRYNAEGEVVFGSPPLLGLPGWYVQAQIQKFQKQQRGVSPSDANGQKMAQASAFVEDQEMLDSLIAYLYSLQTPAPPLKPKPAGEDPFEETDAGKR